MSDVALRERQDVMTDDATANHDAWSSLVARVVAECRERRHFLGRAEERGLKEQAGDDWRAGDEMVDSMNRIVGLARDRALAVLQSWQPAIGDLPTQVGAAIAALESLPDMRDHYCSIGLLCVIHRLRDLQSSGAKHDLDVELSGVDR